MGCSRNSLCPDRSSRVGSRGKVGPQVRPALPDNNDNESPGTRGGRTCSTRCPQSHRPRPESFPGDPPDSHWRRWGGAALMARAGCSPVGGWDPDRGRVRPCPRRLCRDPVRPRRGRPGAGAVRATRASLRGCAGSAERLGARGAGAALGAGGAPGRDELTAVAPGLSAEPGGGSSAAPRRCRAARATMLGLDACELGAQLLELLRLALCARGEPPGLRPRRPRGRGAPARRGQF